MHKDRPFRSAVYRVLVVSSVAPALSLISTFIGGDITDGFAGSGYQNTSFQNLLFSLSAVSMLVALSYLVVFGTRLAAKHQKTDKRYYIIPVLGVVSPILFYFGGMIISIMMFLSTEFNS